MNVKLDLGPLGFEGQWIELRDPKFLTERRFKAMSAELNQAVADNSEQRMWKFLRDQIEAWHVRDGDTGADMVTPATDDVEGLPRGVTKVLVEEVVRLYEQTAPKARSSPS